MGSPTTTTKPNTTNMNAGKTGWEKTCECGFMVRDYNQKEFVMMVQTHVKTTHNQVVSEKDALVGVKTIKM